MDILTFIQYILDLYPQTDEFLSYYLIRYYIWYLLFSGKNATKEEFVEEYKRIKTFYHEKDIKAKFSPLSTKIKGEPLRNRLIVFIFLMMEKIHLIPFFACFYCKG